MHSWGEPVLKCLIFLHRTKESHLWYLTVKNNTASFCCCFNVSAISMGTSVWRGRDREMWKRSKEVKCGGVPPSASLLDSTWSWQTVRAQQHFPISPAVLPWHTGAAAGCGCLPARHVRGDPIGSPSWQLSFRNWDNVKHKARQMQWLLGTWEMRPLAFKSL